MQEYFKHDDIQRGSSLFMKSDSNGTTDKQNSKLPLGIKSLTQGIQHFSNWNELANSIESNKGISFDDSQPNSCFFSALSRHIVFDPTGHQTLDRKLSFYDTWKVNDIKICDDIAFVCYEDYTDISKIHLYSTTVPNLGHDLAADLYQVYKYSDLQLTSYTGTTTNTSCSYFSTMLRLGNYGFAPEWRDRSDSMATLGNMIIKIDLPNESDQSFSLFQSLYKFNSTKKRKYKSLYFIYGGVKPNGLLLDDPDYTYPIGLGRSASDAASLEVFTNQSTDTPLSNDDVFGGYFYNVTDRVHINGQEVENGYPDLFLQLQFRVGDFSFTETTTTQYLGSKTKFQTRGASPVASNGQQVIGQGYLTSPLFPLEINIFKIHPSRKCGKVDIYTKKSGIFTAVINNQLTSPVHTLETNDIIKVSSALFDGTQTGAVDIHPLNGEKFVKKIDNDTIALYDDQFFEKPCSTNNLKSVAGINWTCIGSSNGNFAQSWKYNQTLFSPSGKNGYLPNDFNTYKTTDRINSINLSTFHNNENEIGKANINVRFDKFFENTISGGSLSMGKVIGAFLDSVPEFRPEYTNLNDSFKRSRYLYAGPQDCYPFHSKSDVDTIDGINLNTFAGPYLGNKFGCSIDAKFLRQSGDSKIYILAIGERGSDVSIDFFGIDQSERKIDGFDSFDGVNYIPPASLWKVVDDGYGNSNLYPSFKKRLTPDNLPYGKIHVFEITVDKYNRITNLQYKRTILGDGSSFVHYRNTTYQGTTTTITAPNSLSEPPWQDFNTLNSGDTPVSHYLSATFPIAPFFEQIYDNTSLYWHRAADIHWFGSKIYDYFNNSTSFNLSYKANYDYSSVMRNFINTTNISGEDKSHFGNTFGIRRPDRFNLSKQSSLKSQWYIFPWVDSFGKSVAIGDLTKDNDIQVFGSCSVRSNLEHYKPSATNYNSSISGSRKHLAPILVSQQFNKNQLYPNGYTISSSDADSQIGQITCITLDTSTYIPQKVLEINSGGSVDTYGVGGDPSNYITENTSPPTYTLSKLRTGTSAGTGHAEVIASCHLSASKIIYKDGMLMWADQVLSERKSIINILKYNRATDAFLPFSKIINNFSTPRLSDASLVGDGFGWDIRYDNGILVTNSMTRKNNFNQDIGSLLGLPNGTYRVDCLRVYEINPENGNAIYIQDIFPCFNKLDKERYPDSFLDEYEDYLLDINTITYDNDIHGSQTWNIRLAGRYDTISDKILLKDPIEYSVFTTDFSTNKELLNTLTNTSTIDIEPYLYFTEHFKDDTVYYDYSQKTQFTAQDKNLWSVIDSSKIGNSAHHRSAPVFFIGIPSYELDSYGDLRVEIDIDPSVFHYNVKSIDLDTFVSSTVIDGAGSPFYPKLVLYNKDPRSTIVPNGPSATGSNIDIVPFTDGIFTYDNKIINKNNSYYNNRDVYPPLFRGGASDIFHYGNLAGSSPQLTARRQFLSSFLDADKDFLMRYYGGSITLGELFDATYNKAGNTNKGIISWASNDGGLKPYTTIISPTGLANNKLIFTIPFANWKDFLVKGSLIKSISDNRPLFETFQRIKHGNLISSSPFTGTWDFNFDDENRDSYSPTQINSITIEPYYTLIIGFVIDDVANDQEAVSDLAGPYNKYNKVASPSTSTISTILSKEVETNINNVSVQVSKFSLNNVRYKNKFHKIAYFKYNNQLYNETQKNILMFTDFQVDRYSFGYSSFVPAAIGVKHNQPSSMFIDRNLYTTSDFISNSYAPIIRAAKSNTNSSSYDNGISSKSIQILTSENMFSAVNLNSNTFIKEGEDSIYTQELPTGIIFGYNNFSPNTLLGGFDIVDPDYLSLNIRAAVPDNENIPLYIRFQQSSGDFTLYTNGFTTRASGLTLKIGPEVSSGAIPLYVNTPRFDNIPLFIEEIQPSGNIPLFISAPDIDISTTLVVASPKTATMPIFVAGPTQATGVINLAVRGRSSIASQHTLFVDGRGFKNEIDTLYVHGIIAVNNGISLVMNQPQSGNMTLRTYGAFGDNEATTLNIYAKGTQNSTSTLWIGTPFEVESKQATLAIKDTDRSIASTNTVHIDGKINTANSIKNGDGTYTLERRNNNIDISEDSEVPVKLIFNGQETSTNSITFKNINKGYYTDKTQTSNTAYFGSQPKAIINKNPAFITRQLNTSNNKTNAFYSDESANFSTKNQIIKRESFDANGKHLIVANTNLLSASIDIYNIIDNDQTSFLSKLFISIDQAIPITPQSQDHLYAENGSNQYPFGDSFIGLKRAIKNYFLPSFDTFNFTGSNVIVNDLKISDLGTCAISMRVRNTYNNGTNNQTKIFNIILLFNISNLRFGESIIDPYRNQTTYYVNEYKYQIFEEFGNKQDKHSAAYNMAFSGEDLYFDRRRGQWGQVWRLSQSDNYSNATQVIDYGTHPDVEGYVNPNNIIYIPENTKRAAFGVPLKIYDDIVAGNGAKIMFIGAQLFDPYVFNTLTQSHTPNAVGAVYIYKQSNSTAPWTYFGAVYGKGNTSLNVLANIADYKDSALSNQEYGLFGYDFDYAGGQLVVAEPGGEGNDEINGGKAYLFSIDSSITLLKEYNFNDIKNVDGGTVGIEDNFMSSIVMLNANNPLTYSTLSGGQSIIHSLRNNSSFVNGLAYVPSTYTTSTQAKNNLNNENKYYDANFISLITDSAVNRETKILSLKKLNFGNGQYKLGVMREFYTSTNLNNYQAYLNKLSIIDVNSEPFGLYIAGPSSVNTNIRLSTDGLDNINNSHTLAMVGLNTYNSGLNMAIYSKEISDMIPLHMESLNNNYMSFAVDGTVVPVNGLTTLQITPTPIKSAQTTINVSGIGMATNSLMTIISGNTNPDKKSLTTLFIGQDIDHNDSMPIYVIGAGGGGILMGYTLDEEQLNISISGRSNAIKDTFGSQPMYIKGPDFGIVNSGASLYVTTDIPPTGEAGLYLINSGITSIITGNNDAQVFSDRNEFATLSIVSSIGVTGSAPLYIERPYGALMGLFIKDQNPTGVFSTYISGAYIGSGDMSLSISPPTAETLNIITRGFLE